MKTVEIIKSKNISKIEHIIKKCLAQLNIPYVMPQDEVSNDYRPDLSIALVNDVDKYTWYKIGYRTGMGIPVIAVILDHNGQYPLNLPRVINIEANDTHFSEKLINTLKDVVDITVPPEIERTSFDKFIAWISEDYERLKKINGNLLENLIGYIFQSFDLNLDKINNEFCDETYFKYSKPSLQYTIMCKATSVEKSLGLETIKQAHAYCQANNSAFVMLFSNGYFTSAAKATARCAMPAIYLYDFNAIKDILRCIIGGKYKNHSKKFDEKRESLGLNVIEPFSLSTSLLLRSNLFANEYGTLSTDYMLTNKHFLKSQDNSKICFINSSTTNPILSKKLKMLTTACEHAHITSYVLENNNTINYQKWQSVIKESNAIFVLFDNNDIGKTSFPKRIIELVAHHKQDDNTNKDNLFMLWNKSNINKYLLPICLHGAKEIDNTDLNWINDVKEIINKFSKTDQNSEKPNKNYSWNGLNESKHN